MDEAFEEFISDSRLRVVQEALKRSNDILDIIEMGENQHSEMLKWLFDPREGHGQGDAILKDFLTAAYQASGDNVLCNKDFFNGWPPSRIARTGFQSVITFREYVLPNRARLDLLMLDPINKILIVVENKHGAKLGSVQLETYYQEVAALRARPAFKGYKTAHIVLDRNYGGEIEEDANRASPRNRWAFLDYQWLEAGADRAKFQLDRGNDSARLVIAYCQKQTDYVAPEQKKVDDLLADLYIDHRAVVDALREVISLDAIAITDGQLNGDLGEKWMFVRHHPTLVERLLSKAKLTFIERELKISLRDRDLATDFGKRSFYLFNEKWHVLMNGDKWPVYIDAEEIPDNDGDTSTYTIAVLYKHLHVADEYKDWFQSSLEEEFPELKKGPKQADYRKLGKRKRLTQSDVAFKTQALYLRLERAMEKVLGKRNS
jgi:hypothetical protein